MIIKINKFTRKDIRILAAWNGVSDIVNLIDLREQADELNTWKKFIKFISFIFKSATSEEELKKIKKGFQLAYHSDLSNNYTGRDEKFKQIEDIYELALQNLNKSFSQQKDLNNSNNPDIYDSIKNIDEFMENFVKNVKSGQTNTEDIDVRILGHIKRHPELSLKFSILLINQGLTNDATRLYPGLLSSIASNPQTKMMFYNFLKELNLPVPLQFEKK